MEHKQLIIIAIFASFLAFTLKIIDQAFSNFFPPSPNGGFSWISFQAWALYFLAGSTVKGGIKSFLGYVCGIVASILMIVLGDLVKDIFVFMSAPIAIFLITIPIMLLEKVKWLDFVPSVFIGAGVFFGFITYVPKATYSAVAITTLFYCFLGLFCGFLTTEFRIAYTAHCKLRNKIMPH